MARLIEAVRHSIKNTPEEGDTELISEAGMTRAREVAAARMHGVRYDVVAVSKLLRTRQTLQGFSEGAGIPFPEPMELDFLGAPVSEWKRLCVRGDGVVAISQVDPSAFARIAGDVAELIWEVADATPDNGRALIVCHMPALPLAVYALTGGETILSGLRECEGVLLRFEGNIVTVERELRLP